MTFFGHTVSAEEVLAGGWVISALAHAIPPPDIHSSKFYVFMHNLAQLLCANLSLIQGKPTPDALKIIPIDRAIIVPPSDLPPAA